MGLDQYLHAEKYISGYDHQREEQKNEYRSLVESFGVGEFVDPESPSAYVKFTVAYWRKANAIHQWFVNNCQGGKDECQDTYVSREKLQELLDLCKTVGKSKKKAAELLAPQGGFFFGSTDIDQYYFQDLKDTIEILEKCLTDKFFESCDFYYRSSW